MTREDNELLLKDLCARLFYRVKVLYEGQVKEIQYIEPLYNELKLLDFSNYTIGIEEIKPYLRPMSSMTKEEKEEYDSKRKHICDEYNRYCFDTVESIDWLNAHHFDYRGLIKKGLALEAPEGMYNK